MKISAIESLHCDAGWRNFSFLKIQTDEGITGYSEYNQSYGSRGLAAVIDALAEHVIGQNPLATERIHAELYARTRQAPGGINMQAIAAIENAFPGSWTGAACRAPTINFATTTKPRNIFLCGGRRAPPNCLSAASWG